MRVVLRFPCLGEGAVGLMRDIDWKIIYELHKNPNMTRVSGLLFMTQPSITKRLQNMEEEFGAELVTRTPKGLIFTKKGEYLAKRAGLYLDFLRETKETLEDMEREEKECILVGAAFTYSKYTLPNLLMPYMEAHPDLLFDVINDSSDALFKRLVEGSIHAAFVRGDYKGDIHRILISQNRAVLLTKSPIDSFEELMHMTRIDYKMSDNVRSLLDQWWMTYFDGKRFMKTTVGFLDFACQLISKNFGYTICFLPEDFQNDYHLCITPLKNKDGTDVVRNTWFLYPQYKRIPEYLEEFIHYVEKSAKP